MTRREIVPQLRYAIKVNVLKIFALQNDIDISCLQYIMGPHSHILMTAGMGGGGGAIEVYTSYPKKSQLQNLSTQKDHNFS